eukprot:gene50980-68242_t
MGGGDTPTLHGLVGALRTLFEAETTPVWNPLNLIGVVPAQAHNDTPPGADMVKQAQHVDTAALSQRITRTPFPGSHKVYLEGARPDIRVPFREITLSDTLVDDGAGGSRREPNPPLRVYDASGPYTDPQAAIDITRGLPPLRAAWIADRADTV